MHPLRFGGEITMKGTISSKNDEKGFGFITPEGMEDTKENNVFFHTTSLEGVTFEELEKGFAVEFEKEPSPKGDRAVHVKRASTMSVPAPSTN